MSKKQLGEIIAPDRGNAIQWEAAVPIVTNPFTLVELFQLSLIGAGVALAIMGSGLWIMGSGLRPGDVTMMLAAAAVFFVVVSCVFLVVGLVVFGNRYFALYHLTSGGIYHQGTRGQDKSGWPFIFSLRPVPVIGRVTGKKTREKELPWDKVDHFIDFASMRSVQLKRGRWHLLRLYTPDAETHARVVAYLATRLRQGRA